MLPISICLLATDEPGLPAHPPHAHKLAKVLLKYTAHQKQAQRSKSAATHVTRSIPQHTNRPAGMNVYAEQETKCWP